MPSITLKASVLLVAAAFAAPAAYSQSTTSLNQVVEQTLLTNPEIQARYQDFRQALEGQKVTRGGLMPQVNLQAFAGREYRSYVPSAASDWNSPGYNLELRQLIFDGGRTLNDIKQAGFDKLARYYDLLATSDDTAFAAVQAYLDLQRFRELDILARENFTVHQDTLKQIRERSDSGVGRRVDLEQASGRLALAQTNLMTEAANLVDVESRFRRVTNMAPPDSMAQAPDAAEQLPANPSDFNDSLRRNPSILSKQASLQAADAGISSAKGAYSPRFDFVAATGSNRDLPSVSDHQIQSSSLKVVMSYNLFHGGADAARIRQTTAQSYAARDVRDFTCRNVQQDLAVAWNNVVHLRAQIPFLRDHQISTAKVRDAYHQQFQIGQRSLLDLLNTENELFEARQALVNGEFDLQAAQYRWLDLSHRLLPTLGVQAANDETPEENNKLDISEDIVKACNSSIPDTAGLAPILKATYQPSDAMPVTPQGAPAQAAPVTR